jgi:hypothetical protein
MRSSILATSNIDSLLSDLTNLIHYINRRYPKINTQKIQDHSRDAVITTNFVLQRENSKTDIHNIFNLFDPNVKPKAMLPQASTTKPVRQRPIPLKRVATKLTIVSALSRPQIGNKTGNLVTTTATK